MPINERGEFIRPGRVPEQAEVAPPPLPPPLPGWARALLGVLILVGVLALVIVLSQSNPPQVVKPPLPVDSPVEIIRSYYAALNRRDGESAVGKWKDPNREKLLNMIRRIEWFQTQDVRLVQSDTYSAQVAIDVIGKNFNEKLKHWVGVIILEKVHNQWQIASMKDLREKK